MTEQKPQQQQKPSQGAAGLAEAGRQRLHEGRLAEAAALLKRALEQEPGYMLARKLLGWVAAEQQEWAQAAAHWRTVLAALDEPQALDGRQNHSPSARGLSKGGESGGRQPHRWGGQAPNEPQALAEAWRSLAAALIELGEFDEAGQLLDKLEALAAETPDLHMELRPALELRLAMANQQLDGEGISKAWARLQAERPNATAESPAWWQFIGSEDADDHWRFKPEDLPQAKDAQTAQRILAYLQRLPRQQCLALARQAVAAFPDSAALHAHCIALLIDSLASQAELDEAQARARAFHDKFPDHPQAWRLLAQAAVAANDIPSAQRLLAASAARLGSHSDLDELAMWLAAKQGDHDAASAAWARLRGKRYLLGQDSRRVQLQQLSREPRKGFFRSLRLGGFGGFRGFRGPGGFGKGRARILLFARIRNEREFMPWFLAHYRNLGVEWFFIVDHLSNDGSAEYLLKQKDVTLFTTQDNYMANLDGTCWINELIRRYGAGHWCLFVDADEELVLPDGQDLRQATSAMAAKGEEVMPAYMLDTYPADMAALRDFRPGHAPLEYSSLIDPDYFFTGSPECCFLRARGGVRNRLFGIREKLEKAPLLRGGACLYTTNHSTGYARVSSQCAALLHHKLLREALEMQKPGSDHRPRQRLPIRRRLHERYLRSGYLALTGEIPRAPSATAYQSAAQLQALGLLGPHPLLPPPAPR